MTAPHSVLIVGAGLAGARCAETLRAEGFDGRVVLVGDEQLPPYERPALSKEFLAGKRQIEQLLLRPAPFWDEQGIELLLGSRVVSVDEQAGIARTARGRVLGWDALVLATGARPRRLPFTAPQGVHVLRTLADAAALRKDLARSRRLVVIGGGFLGSEVASTATALGLDVTILEAGSAPFARLLGRDLARLLLDRYRAHGVEVRTATTAARISADPGGRLRGVILSNGTELVCDTVLVAVGVDPAAELVPVDSPRPTFVCGDAAGRIGHWSDAAGDGIDAARRVLGLPPLAPQPPFFWSDQFGLRIQLVGDPKQARVVELEGSDDRFVARYRNGHGRLLAVLAANRPETVGAARRELALAG
jgi:3-phenylpropionate/trans-cinnamate dioxygenase ferredoxin reductase component